MQRISEAEQELHLNHHAHAEDNYRIKEVQLRTLEMGVKDLQQYCKGLEKALLKYHSHKMQSINQVHSFCKNMLLRTHLLLVFSSFWHSDRFWLHRTALPLAEYAVLKLLVQTSLKQAHPVMHCRR
jgi:hypothetical protein